MWVIRISKYILDTKQEKSCIYLQAKTGQIYITCRM